MPCSCGFTTNQDNTCNGNHKIVKSVKDKIILNIEKIKESLDTSAELSVLEKVILTIKETK
jgi:hypothetical protein